MAPAPLTPEALEALTATAGRWRRVTTRAVRGGSIELLAGGRSFARLTADGAILRLPPRVRDMLVETGRAEALPRAGRALVRPGADGSIDLDLLRLAYERARVAAEVAARRAGGGTGAPPHGGAPTGD